MICIAVGQSALRRRAPSAVDECGKQRARDRRNTGRKPQSNPLVGLMGGDMAFQCILGSDSTLLESNRTVLRSESSSWIMVPCVLTQIAENAASRSFVVFDSCNQGVSRKFRELPQGYLYGACARAHKRASLAAASRYPSPPPVFSTSAPSVPSFSSSKRPSTAST